MKFSEVIKELQAGKMAARNGWDSFIFMQVPSIINKDIVPKMTSLPQPVKNEFMRRFNDESMQVSDLYYSNQLAIVNQSNLIEGYSPSVADVFADDWGILNE